MTDARDDDADLRHTGADDDLPPLHVGDHVRDREDDADGPRLLVVGLPLDRAAEAVVSDTGRTVADHNPDYSKHDLVVEVIYPERSLPFLDDYPRYSFPRGRLERVTPVHDEPGAAWDALLTTDRLDTEDDVEYLLGLVGEALREDRYADAHKRAAWAVSAWCQELQYVPDLRDYGAGEQVPTGEVPPAGGNWVPEVDR